jgi:cytochrome c-type biogenesis protein CcmH
MIFWILVGVMTVLALAFVVVPIIKPGMGRKPLLIGGLAVIIPLAAVLAYQKLGTPEAATTPVMPMPPMPAGAMPAGHPDKAMMNMDLGQLADKLAEKLKNQPDNAEGWALLARTYVEVKRHKESLPAFEKAASLLPKDPNLLADYADALAMSNGGKFDKKCEDLIAQALKLDPMHVKALMLKATMAFNGKDYPTAIAAWEKILTVPGLDAEKVKESKGSIEEARRLMAGGK